MRHYDGEETLLDMVELYAEKRGYIASEEELSELFDDGPALATIEVYGADDTVAINESFNNWADSLCKDGIIHPEQYNNYCYVGEYS